MRTPDVTALPGPVPTIGVEEEFFVVAADTGHTLPAGPAIAADCPQWPIEVKTELTPVQVEIATGVCAGLHELRRQLEIGRELIAGAASRHGGLAIACGTPPLDEPGPPPVTESPRYRWLAEEYRELLRAQGVCGCHVHIGLSDPDTAVQVSNHLRPWLPVLLALGSNSPFCGGRDTGYSSWRSVIWSRWPVSGVPPVWASARHLDDVLATLVGTKVIRDKRMAYWLVRPSPRVPTIEIRVTDTLATAEDTVLLAGLVRGLVVTALNDIHRGVPAAEVSDQLARAGMWRAARDGMAGEGLDLRHGREHSAWELTGLLLDHVRPALERAGDLALITSALARVRAAGSGAERQRAVYRCGHDLRRVVDFLATTFNGKAATTSARR